MRQYRIGDFAKYMGVTPDLLKHYEELGLISPQRSGSGYRYYPFHTASVLIESIRLRNYGMTLREIQEILAEKSVPTSKMEKRLDENMEVLRLENQLNQALLEDYDEFLDWKSPLEERTEDWSIRWSRPMCFLPHSRGDEFIDDPRIYELLKDWLSYVPIVKSSLYVGEDGDKVWGLVVDEAKLKRLHLPVNDVVVRISPHKMFYYQFRGEMSLMADEGSDPDLHPVFSLMASMNLQHGGGYYRTLVMPCCWEKGIRYQYGFYAIPLKGCGE